jgi:glucose/galactose transporter
MAVVLALLALMIRRSSLPEIDTSAESESDSGASAVASGRTSVWQYPHLVMGALAIFLYVGAEVMAGDVIGIYGKSLGFNLDQTKYFTTFTLASMLLGYFLSIALIPKFVSQQNFLKYSAMLGIVLTLLTLVTTGSSAVMCIALLGLANAVMWPAIFPLAINGLGRFTQIGSAILVMGIAGGAVIPQVYGLLEVSFGHQVAFVIAMLPCYLYILYYAAMGYKPR